ncbi:hypothetical protein [Paenibacillus physcomitrellae]|uniref:MarR family transcriptional regulator n=1 Tax=Paenibacillus physcomitrellae TaxID=1619311 RepID=A0ABQ1GEL4_9BACL|nr:hypothetical protein [Paenibacillus physcomitrellae]GGA42352.1 hypothetical protein GCM10010917_29540 [Paenibacillus physcomitrellae]
MSSERDQLTLQMECTLFFENNPYAYQTLDGLSTRLGRHADQLDGVLNRLVELSILNRVGDGTRAIYYFNAPYHIIQLEWS